jgi:hypothetical protein
MNIQRFKGLAALVVGLTLPWCGQAAGFHFPVGVAYSSGFAKATDDLTRFYENAGYTIDHQIKIPLGLTLSPYYEWDFGLGVGLSVGPLGFLSIEEQLYSSTSWQSDTHLSYIVPIGADVRYTFFRDKTFAPYLRVGFRYPIVGGPNLDGSNIGPFGAVGVELWRTKKVGMGLEIGYDASKITLQGPNNQKGEVTYAGFTAGISILF